MSNLGRLFFSKSHSLFCVLEFARSQLCPVISSRWFTSKE